MGKQKTTTKKELIAFSSIKSVKKIPLIMGATAYEVSFPIPKYSKSTQNPTAVVYGVFNEVTGYFEYQKVSGAFLISTEQAEALLSSVGKEKVKEEIKQKKPVPEGSSETTKAVEKTPITETNASKKVEPSVEVTGFLKTKKRIEIYTKSIKKQKKSVASFKTFEKARNYLKNTPFIKDADKWVITIQNAAFSDLPQKNTKTQQEKPKKSIAELLHIQVTAVPKTKVVVIKIDNQIFHDFDEAIESVEKWVTVESEETFKKLRLKYLNGCRDKWFQVVWIPRIKEIIQNYPKNEIPFTELFMRMNDYYHKDFSEEAACHILDLCRDSVCCRKEESSSEKGFDYIYSLKTSIPKIDTSIKHISFPQPQQKDALDCCESFQREYESLLKKRSTSSTEDVYLGFDFGTSFTKVAYQYDENNKGVLTFGDTPFKSTVVYLTDTGRLSFFKPNESFKQIQFFKATIVKDKNQYSELRYNNLNFENNEIKNSFEMLCSAFFIANVICYARHKIDEVLNVNPNLYIAMGVPLFRNYDNQVIYNQALHAGIFISETIDNPTQISLKELYSLYNESMKSFKNALYSAYPLRVQHCTIPELFTESLYLLNRTDYMPGYYYIVDIGGGTADFAFIYKAEDYNENQFSYYCPSATVVKLGNEVRKACEGNNQAERNYIEEFGKTYRTTIAKGKFGLDIHNSMIIRQLLFGGGSVEPSQFYQNKTAWFQSGLNSISCKVQQNNSDDYQNSFIPADLHLSAEDKQRLIIATQLAIPETSDAFLSGRPDDYDPNPKPLRKASDVEDNSPGYDDVG